MQPSIESQTVFLIHQPGYMAENRTIIEVKSSNAQ